MKKTIKIIDLLNDLFDYRETMPYKLPKKIKFNNVEFEFKDMSYYSKEGNNIMSYIDHTLDLIVQAELLDEEEFEDIEEFEEHKLINTRDILELEMFINKINADYNYKINQLIKNQKKIIERLKER